ncbi:MAG: cadherin-like beta sandwich domain-containing protein, partial [Acholeplasmataceae bacterium]|nr:cadherin-like beta sandwich domain-containing protein [Acholeplasmataceae bacterium]
HGSLVGAGTKALSPGLKEFTVTAKSEDLSQEVSYKIKIKQTLSDDKAIISANLKDNKDFDYLDFDSSVDEYNIEVGYQVEEIYLVLNANPRAEVHGDGVYPLDVNVPQVITFNVVAENGDVGDNYIINIVRKVASDNTKLTFLTLKDKEDDYLIGASEDNALVLFNEDLNYYQLTVNRNNNFVNLAYQPKDNNATTSGQIGKIALIPGQTNKVEFSVIAESGVVENYTIFVVVQNSDIAITSLAVSGLNNGVELDYNPEIYYYDLGEVENEINYLNINAVISDPYGTLTGDGRQIVFEGLNEFSVKAVSEDKSKTVEYILIVKKKASSGGPLSIDNTLYDILVQGTNYDYIIDYDENQTEYDLVLKYEDNQVYLKPITDPYASVVGAGFHLVEAGSFKDVYLKVTAQDGTESDKIYKVRISREEPETDNVLEEFYIIADGEQLILDIYKSYQEVVVKPDIEAIEIVAVGPNKSVVVGDGAKILQSDGDIYTVLVTAQNGDQNIYSIKIKKQNSDASLISLVVIDNVTGQVLPLSPIFDSETVIYNIDLTEKPEVAEIKIEAFSNVIVKSIDGIGVFVLGSGVGETTDRFLVKVTAEDEVTIKIYEVIITRNIDPEDSIIIDDLTLYGDGVLYLSLEDKQTAPYHYFTYSETNYIIDVPYNLTTVVLSATSPDGAVFTGLGQYSLVAKETTITFKITSKSGNVVSSEYKFKLNKADPSSDNSLKNLTIDGDTIEGFDPEVLTYEYVYDEEKVAEILIGARANDPGAQISGQIGEQQITSGMNIFNIVVTAEDDSIRTYKIKINSVSFDNEIKSLEISGYQLLPDYNPEIQVYRVEIPYQRNHIEIIATAHEKATIDGSGLKLDLEQGSNIFSVYATAENGVKGYRYQIEVYRQAPSDDTTLESLEVLDKQGNKLAFTSEFRPSTRDYIIYLAEDSNLMSVVATAVKNHVSQIVYGAGNIRLEGLVDGQYHNIITIGVEAESGAFDTYTINIYRGITLDDIAEIESVKLIGSDSVTYFSDLDFASDVYSYQITTPYFVTHTALNIEAVGRVYGAGIKTFNNNLITYEFYVESQSGAYSTAVYSLTIVREEPRSNALLTNLTIDGTQVPGFASDKFSYNLTRSNCSEAEILIEATSNEPTAIITGTGYRQLENGTNTITVNVRSEDQSIKSYTLIIMFVDSNALLKNLIIRGCSGQEYNDDSAIDLTNFEFNPETFEYSIVLDQFIRNLRITGAAQDQEGAKVTGFGTYPIGSDDERIRVFVTSADQLETQVYTINTFRSAVLDSNAQLKALSVGDHSIAFEKSKYNYNLTISHKTGKLKISAETFNPNAKVAIENYHTENLTDEVSITIEDLLEGNNVVLLKVLAEDGETFNYYHLNIYKEHQPDLLLTVLLILSILLWIITVLILLFTRNKRKKNEHDELIF